MITDKTFLGFTWPPRMESFRPKVKKKYKHLAIIVSTKDPDVGYVLEFSTEQQARAHVKTALQSTSTLSAEYERTEIPITNEGFIA